MAQEEGGFTGLPPALSGDSSGGGEAITVGAEDPILAAALADLPPDGIPTTYEPIGDENIAFGEPDGLDGSGHETVDSGLGALEEESPLTVGQNETIPAGDGGGDGGARGGDPRLPYSGIGLVAQGIHAQVSGIEDEVNPLDVPIAHEFTPHFTPYPHPIGLYSGAHHGAPMAAVAANVLGQVALGLLQPGGAGQGLISGLTGGQAPGGYAVRRPRYYFQYPDGRLEAKPPGVRAIKLVPITARVAKRSRSRTRIRYVSVPSYSRRRRW